MAFDLTKIAAAMSSLTNWARSGFSNHNVRLLALENNGGKTLVGRFVSSDTEQTNTMNAAPDQATVFNNWYRFSHDGSGVFPAIPAETSAWAYDTPSASIHNTTNSTSYIGVVSSEKYDEYILDVAIRSTSTDDDMIGILLAWYKDPDTGKEYTLEATRTPGGNGPLWAIRYNTGQGTGNGEKNIQDGSASVKWGNGASGSLSAAAAGYVSNTATTGWSGQATTYGTDGHIRVYIQRNGDIITASTSDWAAADTLIPASQLTVDLTSDPVLAKFRGPSQYGFSAFSQQDSYWKVNQFTNPQDVIYNLATRKVYENVAGTWQETTAETIDDLGNNVLLVNPDTGKVFYLNDKDNILVIDAPKLTITA